VIVGTIYIFCASRIRRESEIHPGTGLSRYAERKRKGPEARSNAYPRVWRGEELEVANSSNKPGQSLASRISARLTLRM